MKTWGRLAGLALGVALVGALVLLVTDRRILYWETLIDPGHPFTADGAPVLMCFYFTGRSLKANPILYSEGMTTRARDSCPFLLKGE